MMPININCKCFAFDGKCTHQAAPRKVFGASRCIVWEFHVSAKSDPRISEPICALMVKRWRPSPSSKIQSSASLLDVATVKIPHLYAGLCPDSVNGPESRDPDCPACEAIAAAEAQQERLLQDMHDAGREIDRVMAEAAPRVVRLTAPDIVDALRGNGLYEDSRAFQRLFPILEADARAIESAVLRKNGIEVAE